MSTALHNLVNQPYKHGFVTDIESEVVPKGLSEEVIRLISAKKNEPEWLLEFRLSAYRHWLTMAEPEWANVNYPKIDFQDIIYYSAPKPKKKLASMDEVDPELRRTFEKLGVPLHEQKLLAGVAVDVIFDSVSVTTTYKAKLAEVGIIFCSFSEAVHEHPELVQTVSGQRGAERRQLLCRAQLGGIYRRFFLFHPEGREVPDGPVHLFPDQHRRLRAVRAHPDHCRGRRFGVVSRRLHRAASSTPTSCMRRWSSWSRWTMPTSSIRRCRTGTPGDENGMGGIYNFVTKRGLCKGVNSKISWTQVETGSAITWKYPSCVLLGDNSIGEFYSVALTNHLQQADTGTKMIHVGKNTRSTIISARASRQGVRTTATAGW